MKERLDLLLVNKRLVESRNKAKWLIKEGFVFVDGRDVRKPAKLINEQSKIDIVKEFPYVGRGGLKLQAALKEFLINPYGKVCVDIGASIGGFTDCLLKHGAIKVYAIDTATNLLHPSLTSNIKRVINLLGIDARKLHQLPELIDLATIDITFSSLKAVLPNLQYYMTEEADIIVLIKPLFEMDFLKSSKFTIIRDKKELLKILETLIVWCHNHKFYFKNIIKSPLLGKGGSIEFLAHFKLKPIADIDYEIILREVMI